MRQRRKLRIPTVVDEFTREGHEVYVDYSIPAGEVIEILEFLFFVHSSPAYLRSDNGPEFIAMAVRDWLTKWHVQTAYIELGKPWQNEVNEIFNSRLRDECLKMGLFYGLSDTRQVIENYRRFFNQARLHGALDYVPPSEFKQHWLAENQKDTRASPLDRGDLSLKSPEEQEHQESRTLSTIRLLLRRSANTQVASP